jgi:hypothetical protein
LVGKSAENSHIGFIPILGTTLKQRASAIARVKRLGVVTTLLGSFSPLDWNEEQFVKSPPFTLENGHGKVFATASNHEAETILDHLPTAIGLRKRKQGRTHYLITKGKSVKAFRQFVWFARKSWRSREYSVLWAVVYLRDKKGWSDSPITLDEIAGIAGSSRRDAAEALAKLGSKPEGQNHTSSYQVDKQTAELMLDKLLADLPNLTEEIIMHTLCSGIGGSASEVYERVIGQGLGMSATYKTLEKLKQKDHVYAMKHYRVNERGPMRELLVANCRTCFYGYASPEHCLADTLRQVEDMLETYYGKALPEDIKEELYASIRAVPYSSRLGRRVYELLKLMHEVDHISREGGVQTVLGKIEESYGEEFPLKKTQGNV